MAELKKKVTLKRKIEIVTPVSNPKKGKNKLLMPLLIIGLLAALVGGYFLLKPDGTIEAETSAVVAGSDQQVPAEVAGIIPESSEQAEEEQIAVNDQASETMGAVEPSPEKQGEQSAGISTSKEDATITKPKESKPTPDFPYKKGESYKVYQFPFGAADYSNPDAELDKLAQILAQNPTVKIVISAFTDNVGDAAFNQRLSELRAKAINDYLVKKGIEATRLSYNGKGISTSYATQAQNRRAEFVLSN